MNEFRQDEFDSGEAVAMQFLPPGLPRNGRFREPEPTAREAVIAQLLENGAVLLARPLRRH